MRGAAFPNALAEQSPPPQASFPGKRGGAETIRQRLRTGPWPCCSGSGRLLVSQCGAAHPAWKDAHCAVPCRARCEGCGELAALCVGGCQREICSPRSESNRCSGRSCPGSKQRGEGLGRWSEGWEAIPNGKGLQVLNISLFPCEDHAGGGTRCKALLHPVSLGGSHSADWSISHTGSAPALPPLVWVSGLRGH